MQIDFNDNGNPLAMLVSFSPAPAPGTDGKYFTVFIPVQDILDLADIDQTLIGHPWLDAPPEALVIQPLSRSDHNRLVRYIDLGRYIAIRAVGQRGVQSKGCRLDAEGQPIVKYRYSWRRPEKYLSEQDMFWLASVSEMAQEYCEQFFAAVALGEFFQALAVKLTNAPRVKKPKIKAKDRRRMNIKAK